MEPQEVVIVNGAAMSPVNGNGTIGTSFADSNSVTSPAALASIGAPAVTNANGIYDCEVIYTITGTAETKPNNLQFLNYGGSQIVNLPTSPGSYRMRFSAWSGNGGGVLLRAATAGTVGAIYTATIIATQVA